MTSPQGLPSTVALPDDSHGAPDYTRRYTPGTDNAPASAVSFPAPGERTSSWGPDPGVGAYGQQFKLGRGRVQIPAGSAPDDISGAPRKLKGVEVTGQAGTQVRISSATPTGQRQVRDAAGNTWTETTYRFDYQKRTLRSGGLGAAQLTVQGGWSDISPGEARQLFDSGIPRPRALGGPTGGR
ncbi:hypothetical protein [uncultured Williamsia sp.]|uniref:hypothetical protein n=1 Tax=uncultured Williamsia sp. TaxID=259311 RepID=UPI002617AE00|nr:hypothetical protein [uncultured Williamsia sp.]